ncbi:MAG: hypothetical protein LBR51_08065 [Bacteroidales bacterium]|jgi:tetratricopeptide (TPR) repeat protein|nr:hypothetical protein [Bacteroidales bacterium]
MKRLVFIFLFGVFVFSVGVDAQPCVDNASMALKNKSILKAKRDIDVCGDEDKADVQLMRGYVYLQYYNYELDRLARDANYAVKEPDALFIAFESFYKAIQLNPKVTPRPGCIESKVGQSLCAQEFDVRSGKLMETKQYDLAERYLKAAIRAYSMGTVDKNTGKKLEYLYNDLSKIAKEKNDMVAYHKILEEAASTHVPAPVVYRNLYEWYKSGKDTTNCKRIIGLSGQAFPKVLKDTLGMLSTIALRIDYASLKNDTVSLKKQCKDFLELGGETPDNLSEMATYLNNAGMLDKAEIYCLKGLEKDPNHFELTLQMAYRYVKEVEDFQTRIDKAINEDYDFNKATALKSERKPVAEKAHDWLEKAWNIKHEQILKEPLRQLKTLLQKEIPEELKN